MNEKRIICSFCGSILNVDLNNEVVICKKCGNKISLFDTNNYVEEYIVCARKAFKSGAYQIALKNYINVSNISPNNCEAIFFISLIEYIILADSGFYRSGITIDIDEYLSKINRATNKLLESLPLVIDYAMQDNQTLKIHDIYEELNSNLKINNVKEFFLQNHRFNMRYYDYICDAVKVFHLMGDCLLKYDNQRNNIEEIMINSWKRGNEIYQIGFGDKGIDIYVLWNNKRNAKQAINSIQNNYREYTEKIKRYDKKYCPKRLKVDKANKELVDLFLPLIVLVGVPGYFYMSNTGFFKVISGIVFFPILVVCVLLLFFLLCKYIYRKM